MPPQQKTLQKNIAAAILKTELNSTNRIEAINTLAMPVVTESFNMVN